MIDSAMTEPLAQVSSDVAMEVVEGDEVFHSSSKERLPFAFSHRFQLVLAKENEQLCLFYTDNTPLNAMLEVRHESHHGRGLPHQYDAPKLRNNAPRLAPQLQPQDDSARE